MQRSLHPLLILLAFLGVAGFTEPDFGARCVAIDQGAHMLGPVAGFV